MISLFNLFLIVLVCLLAGGMVWLANRNRAGKKELEQLTQKLNRLTKRQKQKKAKPSAPPFEQILNLMSGGIVVSDRDGKIIWHNEEAADILDFDSAEMTRGSIMSLLSPLPMLISNSIGESEVAPAEFDINGRRIEGTMFVLYGKDGLDRGTVAILNDVTTWHAALRTKQKQLDEINHELRQRLTSMGSFTEMLGTIESDSDNPWLPRLHDTVGRVTELIDTIMQISAVKSNAENVSHVLIDVPEMISETLDWLKPELETNQIFLKQQVDDDIRPIKAQPVHIQTILKELLTNSIQFNRAGGMVQIRAATNQDEESKLEFLVLQISDDGQGIPSEDQKKIFDIFYRPDALAHSQQRSIGVGLAIVHAIVEAYDGRIWFKSQEGKGSAFTVLLPSGLTAEEIASFTEVVNNEEEDEFAWIEDTA